MMLRMLFTFAPHINTTQPLNQRRRRQQQVLKPEDVRQDAVMMQVFSTVNALLARDPAARRRALAIRTYRVVPLTPDSGVLEYVGNTKVRTYVATIEDRWKRLRPMD
jgi:ataxia telangiectasia mutated family protein